MQATVTYKAHYTDIGNAKIFTELFKDKVRWCNGDWYIYNGRYWQRNSNGIKSLAIECSYKINSLMGEINTQNSKRHANRSANNSGLNAMVECAKAFLSCDVSEFDKDEYLFNCLNGTYDLKHQKFCGFDNADLITKSAYIDYNPYAKCPTWDKFIDEIFLSNEELKKFFMRAVGYSMTGSNKEQSMFILYGHGRNGKGSVVQTLANILGDYGMGCPSSTLLVKNGNVIPNDVARLKGSRFVMASETNQNVTLDEALIKQITGGDRITARFLNKEFFDFTPTFKIFFATNHKPNIRGTDTGIWRRIKMIPFQLNVTEDKEDMSLGDKLNKEREGILNRMIEGYKDWSVNGLSTPNAVKLATQLYREEEDDLGQFIYQECITEKDSYINVTEFKERFKVSMGYYKSAKIINEYMARNGHKPSDDNRYRVKGKQIRAYVNIRWRTEMDNLTKEAIQWQN